MLHLNIKVERKWQYFKKKCWKWNLDTWVRISPIWHLRFHHWRCYTFEILISSVHQHSCTNHPPIMFQEGWNRRRLVEQSSKQIAIIFPCKLIQVRPFHLVSPASPGILVPIDRHSISSLAPTTQLNAELRGWEFLYLIWRKAFNQTTLQTATWRCENKEADLKRNFLKI